MAPYPSTVYRVNDAGEVDEVVVEETDEVLQVDRAPAAASQPQADQAVKRDTFDEIAWWSRQLGRRLSAAGRKSIFTR